MVIHPMGWLSRTDQLLLAVAARDGWNCHYCASLLVPRGRERTICDVSIEDDEVVFTVPIGWAWPTIDHKQPRSRGGSDDLFNLVLACNPCNARKGTRPYETFVAALRVLA